MASPPEIDFRRAAAQVPDSFRRLIEEEWERAARQGGSFAVVLFGGPLSEEAVELLAAGVRTVDRFTVTKDRGAGILMRETHRETVLKVAQGLSQQLLAMGIACPCTIHPFPPAADEVARHTRPIGVRPAGRRRSTGREG